MSKNDNVNDVFVLIMITIIIGSMTIVEEEIKVTFKDPIVNKK